jgi:hypothetical protein
VERSATCSSTTSGATGTDGKLKLTLCHRRQRNIACGARARLQRWRSVSSFVANRALPARQPRIPQLLKQPPLRRRGKPPVRCVAAGPYSRETFCAHRPAPSSLTGQPAPAESVGLNLWHRRRRQSAG